MVHSLSPEPARSHLLRTHYSNTLPCLLQYTTLFAPIRSPCLRQYTPPVCVRAFLSATLFHSRILLLILNWIEPGMLYRMYKRFAERKGFKVTIMEEIPADFGIKSCEIRIEGPYAYGFLSGEKGTHRLVRISPFNAQGKRQTSFVGV